MGLYRDQAVVLRTYRLGEADRIVVLCTQEHGVVRAVAKGVRRTRSRFGGRLEPTSHVAVQLYQGRGELETVSQTETLDGFRGIREDLSRLGKAMALLEAVDRVAGQHRADPELYRMLVGALRTLEADDSPLVVPAFYLKLLTHEGVGPVVGACASCGSTDDLAAFDYAQGGVLCRGCRRGAPLSSEAVAMLQQVLGGGLADALAAAPGPAHREVQRVATEAMEHHLERRLRTVGAYGVD